jgi:exopolysaccharide production protein ExoQ
MGALKEPEAKKQGRAWSAAYGILAAIAVVAMWLALGASSWATLNWKLLGTILEERVEPSLAFVHYGGMKIVVSGLDLRDIIYALVVAGVLAAVVARPSQIPDRRFWIGCIPLAAIVVLSRASLDWSIVRSISLADLAPFFVFSLAAVLWGALLSEREILTVLEALAVAAIVLNLAAPLLYPNLSMSVNKGELEWRALFDQKNSLGPMMVFANTIMLVRLSSFRSQNWLVRIGRLLMFVFSLFILWKTRAVASYFAMMGVYFVYLLALLYLKIGSRLRWGHWLALGATGLLGGLLLWVERAPVLAVFNRTSSLTGRLPLWRLLGWFIAKRPLLGYGFGDPFWVKKGKVVKEYFRWGPPHAQNGFIDFTLELGVVGALLLLVFFAQTIIGAASHLRRNRTATSAWPLLLVVVVILPNLSESLLGSREFFYWFLLVLTFSFTLQEWLRHRVQSSAPVAEATAQDGAEIGTQAVSA